MLPQFWQDSLSILPTFFSSTFLMHYLSKKGTPWIGQKKIGLNAHEVPIILNEPGTVAAGHPQGLALREEMQ